MKQSELERAVAASTGESLHEIRRRGFSIMPMNLDDDLDVYSVPQVVDWDAVDQDRQRAA